MNDLRPAASVDQVVALYAEWAGDPYDEEVSQLDHALQTAANAEAVAADDELVVAALLHDVGHLLVLRDRADRCASTPDDDLRHQTTGAAWLAGLYPAGVTAPIALHVRAKRYRCSTDPDYLARLSAGSTRSLVRQGGPLSADQVLVFRANPNFEAAIRLRAWDDDGKVDGRDVRPFDHYTDLLRRLAR